MTYCQTEDWTMLMRKIHFVLIDQYKALIFRNIKNNAQIRFRVIWSDSELAPIPRGYKKYHDYDDGFDQEVVTEALQEKLLLRLYDHLNQLITNEECDKIVILISMHAASCFRQTVPNTIADKIVLQISKDYSDFSLRDIEKKVLHHFI